MSDHPEPTDTGATTPDRPAEPDHAVVDGELVVDRGGPAEEEIEHPTRLLRIAAMVRGLLREARDADLDEQGRQHLGEIHRESVTMLREVMSDDLAAELDQVTLDLGDGIPSASELRIAQAQLAGWLEGLFHGIQASMASQQLATRQQLQQALERGQPGGESGTGQYL